jgi:molybdate transport system regulatory protein
MARVRATIKRIPMPRSSSPAPSPRRASLSRHLKPRQKLWLNWDGAFLMGPRYLVFLDAVARTGTIRAAGEVVGWSYRTCLNRIRQMERVLGAKVLATARGGPQGGGARLTTEARRLVKVFAQWRGEVDRLSHAAFRKILGR